MSADHRPEDEDTKEHVQPDGFPAAGRSGTPADAAPRGYAPAWSSQSGDQSSSWPAPQQPWQPRASQPAWRSPPNQQPGQQPAGGQGWPEPGWAGQQGWNQPGYWPSVPRFANNPLVIISGIVLIVFGLLVTAVALVGMLVGVAAVALVEELVPPDVALEFDVAAFSTVVILVMGTALVVGLLHLLSAIGVFMHKGWGRVIGIVLSMLGLLLGVIGTAVAMQGAAGGYEAGREATTPIIISIAYGFTLFSLIASGGHFRPRY